MNDVEFRVVTANEAPQWDEFVRSRPDANLGHLYQWRHVIEHAYRQRCYFLAALRGDSWLGILPLVHMRGFLAQGRLVSLPFLDQAGVLSTSIGVSTRLRQEAVALGTKLGASGVELRVLSDSPDELAERVTLVLDLPETEDELWKSFKPKVRNQVRKSQKGGLEARCCEKDRLPDFYRVFCENMRDLGSPVHAQRFLEITLDSFGDAGKLYLTEGRDGRVVGGAIALRSGDTVTVPWASSLRSAFEWCPNHCLYWSILRGCVAEGVRRFDFGRSWSGAGTHKFKAQWGAVEHPLAWSAFDVKGEPLVLGGHRPTDEGLAVRLWKRLPLAVANTAGPIIRRQLSN